MPLLFRSSGVYCFPVSSVDFVLVTLNALSARKYSCQFAPHCGNAAGCRLNGGIGALELSSALPSPFRSVRCIPRGSTFVLLPPYQHPPPSNLPELESFIRSIVVVVVVVVCLHIQIVPICEEYSAVGI